MRAEYDLSTLTGRVQGKHHAQATAGVAMVLLESDIAEAWPTGQAVNKALGSVLVAKRKATLANRRCSRRAARRSPMLRHAVPARLAAEPRCGRGRQAGPK